MAAVDRERPIRKMVSFSDAEWRRVERRMKASGARSFDAFARDVLQSARVKVVQLPFDPSEIRYELSRIGNNLNQIARKVNTNNETMVEDMRSARDIMREVQKVLTEQVKRGQR
ncbi:MAG TPA: MobC family plasmid mobilization relaxosome protein [Brachybacterium faecium]|nr:MobC family plasmid mobilization relaxosome protein [Brachybacterium faecium]